MMGFNRWGQGNPNFHSMPGYCHVDYNQGWNPQVHDQMLLNNVRMVYQQYDMNRTGQLEGQEFFYAYRDLCLKMGIAPPQSYQEVWQAAMSCDNNRDGRTSPQEMFMLFKRIQGINQGQMMAPQNFGW